MADLKARSGHGALPVIPIDPWPLIPPWLASLLIPRLGFWLYLGIAFVLGNFATATLSDLRHMSAQHEFVTTWELILLALVVYDVIINLDALMAGELVLSLALKYGLIVAFCLLSHERIGVLFRLATGDVVALACASALLSPILVILFFVLVKLFDLLEAPLLRRVGADGAYPFMPVVFSALSGVLALGLWVGGAF